MKISEMTMEEVLALSTEQKWKIVCDGVKDDGRTAPVAVLLGGRPKYARERAITAAELYRLGRTRYIVPSGGVEWDVDGEMISEVDYMTKIMIENGVPTDAIIPEREATTTRQNMRFARPIVERLLEGEACREIIIVTSQNHMNRGMALARHYMPKDILISAYPSFPNETYEEQITLEEYIGRTDMFLAATKKLIDSGIMEDVEV